MIYTKCHFHVICFWEEGVGGEILPFMDMAVILRQTEIDWNSLYKIYCLSINPLKSIPGQIRPCHKEGQRQHSHYMNRLCIEPESSMLYVKFVVKFQGHWPSVFR